MDATRSFAELLDLPFIFSQRPLISETRMQQTARDRGVQLGRDGLEALHRVGALVPMFRVAKNVRSAAAYARHGKLDPFRRAALFGLDLHASGLRRARAHELLHDPGFEPFRPWSSYARELQGGRERASEFVYSPYQLLDLPNLAALLQRVSWRPSRRRPSVRIGELDHPRIETHVRVARERLLVLSAIEPWYLPEITLSYRQLELSEVVERDARKAEFEAEALRAWLGISAKCLRKAAEALLVKADDLDPLSNWLDLLVYVHPEQWGKLRREALVAVERRVAAEMLLQFYDDLVTQGHAPPLPVIPDRMAHPLRRRLVRRPESLDATLTKYGLSPHPSLVLVVEGETEELLIPNVMGTLGITRSEDFIALVSAQGIAQNLGLLAAYVAKPRLGEEAGGYVEFDRPLTRFLVVGDPEGPLDTPEKRERSRQKWLARVAAALPARFRTDAFIEELDPLVQVRTWTTRGESFEFAHFSDTELARALAAVKRRQTQLKLSELRARVQAERNRHGNLKNLLGGSSKITLAKHLWPVLLKKIEKAQARDSLLKVPVCRTLIEAVELAVEYPRSSLVTAAPPPEDS